LAVVCVSARAAAPTGYPPIRRVVTGYGDDHVAKVLMDGPATNAESPRPGVVGTLVWSTDGTPAAIPVGDRPEDMGARKLGTTPPPNGSRFTVIDYPPGNTPAMHRTETIDYVIVMDGEIDMDMPNKSTVKLKAGDIVVQRGADHAWANRSNKPARLAFVLIDAKPLGIGHPVTGLDTPK
jgi:quercetin dioxygenase-like cupin family protein